MKSIKEKAEEYIGDYYKKLGVDKNLYPIDVEISKADFEAGANYVLGEILGKTSKCITVKDAYEAFLECVEQLKK